MRNELPDISDWKRGKGSVALKCCEQDRHGEDEPLLLSSAQRRQQDFAARSALPVALGRAFLLARRERAVLRDRGELQLLRPVGIAFSMSFNQPVDSRTACSGSPAPRPARAVAHALSVKSRH